MGFFWGFGRIPTWRGEEGGHLVCFLYVEGMFCVNGWGFVDSINALQGDLRNLSLGYLCCSVVGVT
jgi:hypothetical protein